MKITPIVLLPSYFSNKRNVGITIETSYQNHSKLTPADWTSDTVRIVYYTEVRGSTILIWRTQRSHVRGKVEYFNLCLWRTQYIRYLLAGFVAKRGGCSLHHVLAVELCQGQPPEASPMVGCLRLRRSGRVDVGKCRMCNSRYAARFRVRIPGAHALRVISRVCKEGSSTASSIICDRWLWCLLGWGNLSRWLMWLSHSAHRPGRSIGEAGCAIPGSAARFQGRMLWD